MSSNAETTNSITRNPDWMIVGTITAVCLLIYAQVIRFEFINLDDNVYVYANPFVGSGLNAASIRWAFTAFYSANWHPLTWLSHMLDAEMFGPNAGGHHFVNVIFHIANSLLSFVIFRRLTGDVWKSAIVALLFAIHPTHVESVAWVSERKDVLSTFFWMLTMLCYVRFTERPDKTSPLRSIFTISFFFTLVCFSLGLMSKPMLVTLPFVLMLCDYWPLGRLKSLKDIGPLIIEKLPLFALTAASCFITIRAQSSFGAIQSSTVLPFETRLANAVISYAKYVGMAFYPAKLGIGYEYDTSIPAWQIFASAILLLLVTGVCIWHLRRRKYLIVGWLWFLGTLVPVIGLVQVGSQPLADRYTYVPYFGLFIMTVWGVAEFLPRLRLSFANMAIVIAFPIAVLSVTAYKQTSRWRDSVTLYTHSIRTSQGNFIVMHNLCSALAQQNRVAEAEIHCRNSIAAEPTLTDAHIMLGVINVRLGKNDEAIDNFRTALEQDPNNSMALANIAVPLALTGRTEEAETSLDQAVEFYRKDGVDPRAFANSYLGLGSVFARQGKFDRAAAAYKRVVDLDPGRADAHTHYAYALYLQDKLAEASIEIEQAIAKKGDQAESYNVRGLILLKQNQTTEAIRDFERALQLKPGLKDAHDNLEKARGLADDRK